VPLCHNGSSVALIFQSKLASKSCHFGAWRHEQRTLILPHPSLPHAAGQEGDLYENTNLYKETSRIVSILDRPKRIN
jgi:hypothetical protein